MLSLSSNRLCGNCLYQYFVHQHQTLINHADHEYAHKNILISKPLEIDIIKISAMDPSQKGEEASKSINQLAKTRCQNNKRERQSRLMT